MNNKQILYILEDINKSDYSKIELLKNLIELEAKEWTTLKGQLN